jgi:hypothetical protein
VALFRQRRRSFPVTRTLPMLDADTATEPEEINMPAVERTRWGPFSPGISAEDRLSRLRVARAFVQRYVRPGHPIHAILCDAESGEPEDLELARLEFDRLPALPQRHILDSYAQHWQRKPRPRNRRMADAV